MGLYSGGGGGGVISEAFCVRDLGGLFSGGLNFFFWGGGGGLIIGILQCIKLLCLALSNLQYG